jgi:hypothetical protein
MENREMYMIIKRKNKFLDKKVTGFVVSRSIMKTMDINRDMKNKLIERARKSGPED